MVFLIVSKNKINENRYNKDHQQSWKIETQKDKWMKNDFLI